MKSLGRRTEEKSATKRSQKGLQMPLIELRRVKVE